MAKKTKMKVMESGVLKGVNRCTFHRDHNLDLSTGTGKEAIYQRSDAIKQTIKEGLVNGFTEDSVMKGIEESFSKIEYPTEQTRKEQMQASCDQILRYLNSEVRVPYFPKKDKDTPARAVEPFGLCRVIVRPDMIYIGHREFDRVYFDLKGKRHKYRSMEPYIEIVKIKASKPTITQRGKKKDGSVTQCMELYSMLMYGRELANMHGYEDINIGASYYFLRKKNDSDKLHIKSDPFFEAVGAGNVATLWERWDKNHPSTELDRIYKPQFESFLKGEEECDPNVCKNCTLFETCNYTRPPKVKDEEFTQKDLSDIVLSDDQEKAIAFRKGVCRINAGAGAGKTLVTALRVAYMLEEGIRPEEICMLTFTNAGAQEMRERVRLYTEDLGCEADVDKLTSTTFNSFGDRIVKKNHKELGFLEAPMLIDEIQKALIIEELLKKKNVPGLDYKNFSMDMPYVKGALAATREAFDVIKRERLSIGDEETLQRDLGRTISSISDDDAYPALIDLYFDYESELKERCLIEYADQELLTMDLLKKNPFYFEDYGFKHIIVDEFQDTNELQFKIIKSLIDTPSFESLMVVGDDSQSIFGFRGSTPEFIIDFFGNLGKSGEDIYLLDNYRSTPEIIEFANKINSLNKHRVVKDLVSKRKHGMPVVARQFSFKEEEEEYIVRKIQEKHEAGVPYEDMTYIASTRSDLMKMGCLLNEWDIPWIMLNPEPMLENSRVVAAIAFAKFVHDTTDTHSAFVYLNAVSDNTLLDTHTDKEIKASIALLAEEANRIMTENDLEGFQTYLEDLKNEDEIYDAFLSMLRGSSLSDRISYCIAFHEYGTKQARKRDLSYPGIVLTTAHSSKGLEFPIVFNEISKYEKKGMNSQEREEQRRLMFVSCTRAKDELYVIGQTFAYGRAGHKVVNRFLLEAYEALGQEFNAAEVKRKKK